MTGIHRLSKQDVAPGVGRDMDAHCTRCKMLLNHTIVAMVGTTVVQVRCNTCGGTHKFKDAAPKPPTEATRRQRVARAATATAGALEVARRRFQRRLEEYDTSTAIDYTPRLRPEPGQLMRHAKFGLGIVQAVAADKATVQFEEGDKLLVVGR